LIYCLGKRGQFVFNVQEAEQQQQYEEPIVSPETNNNNNNNDLAPNGGNAGKKVVGYYTFWSPLDVKDIPGNALTHIMYAFVNIDSSGRCVVGQPSTDTQRVFGVQDECGCCAKGRYY
jgi:GH18 family chitinase